MHGPPLLRVFDRLVGIKKCVGRNLICADSECGIEPEVDRRVVFATVLAQLFKRQANQLDQCVVSTSEPRWALIAILLRFEH